MRSIRNVMPWATNATLIGWLLTGAVGNGNDKERIVLLFGYLLVVVVNLTLWGLLVLLKSNFHGPMGKYVLILSVLFVPLLVYALNQ